MFKTRPPEVQTRPPWSKFDPPVGRRNLDAGLYLIVCVRMACTCACVIVCATAYVCACVRFRFCFWVCACMCYALCICYMHIYIHKYTSWVFLPDRLYPFQVLVGIRNAFDPRVVDQRQTHSSLQLHKCYFQIDSILLRSALVPYLNLTPPMLPTSANRILPWSIMSDTPGSDRNYKSIFLRSLLVSLCFWIIPMFATSANRILLCVAS